MKVNKLFFFVISFFGLIPAIYQTTKGKQTVSEFINNNRNFSGFQLNMTMFATVISLGGVSMALNGSYTGGLSTYLPWMIGTFFVTSIMVLLIPHLGLFFKKNHFGAVIETLGGWPTALITKIILCLGAILLCIGQFKLGIKSAYFLTETQKSIFLWGFGLLIAVYVVRGGITSVVNSDIIQLFLGMSATITIFFLGFWYMTDVLNINSEQLIGNIKYDIQDIKFDAKFFNFLILMSLPSFAPGYTSRIFLAKDQEQAKQSFIWLGIGWFILSTILYLAAKTIYILNPNIQSLDIAQMLKTLYPITEELQIVLLVSIFMFAVTTIDSLLQFVTVEIATSFTKEEEKLSKLFKIIPFILMFLICLVAQNDEAWQLNYYYIFNIAQMFFFPVVTPIILFYCLTGLRFVDSKMPLSGILTGVLATLVVYNNDFLSFLNPGIVGGIANLLVLLIGKKFVAHENANN